MKVQGNFEVVETALKNKEARESTIQHYKMLYDKHLCNIDLDNYDCIKGLLNDTKIKLSVRNHLKAIIILYLKATGQRRTIKKIQTEIDVRYRSKKRDIEFTQEEIVRVIHIMKQPWSLMLRIVWETGLRRKILLHLTPDMCDFENNIIKVNETIPGNKAKVNFDTQLTKETMEELKIYITIKQRGINSAIFKINKKYPLQTINNAFMYYAKKAGIADSKHFTPHSIRHSHATHFYNKGGQIEALSYELGHKDIKTTQRYTHKKKDLLVKEHEKIKWR